MVIRDVKEAAFITSLEMFAEQVYFTAVEKGWWDEERNDGELIALMHSELSEMLEGLRAGNPQSDKLPEFTQAEEELADVFIRGMDMAKKRGYRLAEAIVAKARYNTTRPRKHGGKRF